MHGTFQLIDVEVGELVAPGDELAGVSDPTHLKAELKIPETLVNEVAVGQRTEVDTRNGVIQGKAMTRDVLEDLKGHYAAVAEELRSNAEQAGLLANPTGVGTQREEVYQTFLKRHLPKTCDVFLGGYLFDRNGKSSAQIDVIVTTGTAPRFQMSVGNRHIAPLEGAIAVAEVKSRLDKDSLRDALENCAAIPPMPDSKGIVPPYLRVSRDRWRDTPYKIVFAYDGISAYTALNHITQFYNENENIPTFRRPNLIHVLGKYVVIRTTLDMIVTDLDGQPDAIQPMVGQYQTLTTGSDISTMSWMLNHLQQEAFQGNHLLIKYDELHNKIVERIKLESAG